MVFQIVAVCDRMLPIPTLPKAAFAFGDLRCTPVLAPGNATRERLLDMRPSDRIIRITRWKGPQAVQVLRQNHDCIDGERLRCMRNTERMTQIVDMIGQQRPSPLGDGHREKVGAARHPRAAIVRHRRSIPDAASLRGQKTPRPIPRKTRCWRRVGFMPTIVIRPTSLKIIGEENVHQQAICPDVRKAVVVGIKPTLRSCPERLGGEKSGCPSLPVFRIYSLGSA
jgi:hypothetical protein